MREYRQKIVDHLLTQRAQAVDMHGDCFYRAPEGRMCAVGCLIPDEQYIPYFDQGAGVEGVVLGTPAIKAIAEQYDEDYLVRELLHWQRYHDYITRVGEREFSYSTFLSTGDEAHHPMRVAEAMEGLFGA